MIVLSTLKNDSSCTVLNRLKPLDHIFRLTLQQGVTIIQFRCHKSMDNDFCRILSKKFSTFRDIAYMAKRRFADRTNMGYQGKRFVK